MDIDIRYQVLLGCPETSAFNNYVINNLLINFNITVDDINRSEHIYGEATTILQGKLRRRKPTVHSKTEKNNLPLPMSERHKTYIYTWTFLRKWFNIHTQ